MNKSKPTKDSKKPAADDKPAPQDGGWRETVESVAMAVILALLFRGFVAEAFVIPTGSMAPTLDGRHKDLKCPKCGAWYQVSCSPEADNDVLTGRHVVNGTCSVCRYTQRLDPLKHPNEGSFSGDRIIVGKFAYDLAEPKRWDVIVFKFPGNAAVNYIKRLIGLPGERVWIVGGNIYTCGKDESDDALKIARKPPAKLDALLQIVDDTNHIPQDLVKLGWPSRWQNWPSNASESGGWEIRDGGREIVSSGAGDGEHWLRYRHLVPSHDDWQYIEERKELPPGAAQRQGELIADYYSYNTAAREQAVASPVASFARWPISLTKSYRPPIDVPQDGPLGDPPPLSSLGEHWVDDLAMECTAEVTSNKGELSLMLVRGGMRHVCRIDLANGKATMSITDDSGAAVSFQDDDGAEAAAPTTHTTVKGPGKYRLRLSNCDHEMLLWVNGKVVEFDGPTTYDTVDLIEPHYSAADPGDLAPAGVASRGAAVKLSSLRTYRDKYYIATTGSWGDGNYDYTRGPSAEYIRDVFRDPTQWDAPQGLFGERSRRHIEIVLQEDQFLPLGDNSPQSSDGRYWQAKDRDERWGDHRYVERDLLIGKALMIYWPHTWNRPIPYQPKVTRMGPIR